MQGAEGCRWEAVREEMGSAGITWEGWTPQCPTHSRNPPCPPAAALHLGGVFPGLSSLWPLGLALAHWPLLSLPSLLKAECPGPHPDLPGDFSQPPVPPPQPQGGRWVWAPLLSDSHTSRASSVGLPTWSPGRWAGWCWAGLRRVLCAEARGGGGRMGGIGGGRGGSPRLWPVPALLSVVKFVLLAGMPVKGQWGDGL